MTATIILGGGCFWCTESVFQRLRGVREVQSGYCGGDLKNPSYEQVCSGQTGHVEVIRITFNPQEITLRQLYEVFFATHDPTTLNRQGADIGTQYASVIFYADAAQKELAEAVIDEMAENFSAAIVTQLKPATTFWEAEEIHNNYYDRNPNQRYCQLVIAPKVQHLKSNFTAWLR